MLVQIFRSLFISIIASLVAVTGVAQEPSPAIFSSRIEELSYIRFDRNAQTGGIQIRRCAVSGSGCSPQLIFGREFSAHEIALAQTRLANSGQSKMSTCDPFFSSVFTCMAGGFGGGILVGLAAAAVTGVGVIPDAAYLGGFGVFCAVSAAANLKWNVGSCMAKSRIGRAEKLLSQKDSRAGNVSDEFYTDELIKLLEEKLKPSANSN